MSNINKFAKWYALNDELDKYYVKHFLKDGLRESENEFEDEIVQFDLTLNELNQVIIDVDKIYTYNTGLDKLKRDRKQILFRNDSRVDRDITLINERILDLQSKQNELLEKYELSDVSLSNLKTVRSIPTKPNGYGIPRVKGDAYTRRVYKADEIGELSDADYDRFAAEVEMLRDEGLNR